MRHTLMRLGHAHGRDDPALGIVPSDGADLRGLADNRVTTLCADHKRGTKNPPIAKGDLGCGPIGTCRNHRGGGQNGNGRIDDRLSQSGANGAIF